MSLVLSLLTVGLVMQGEKPTATVKLAAPTATVGQAVKGTLTLVLPEGLHGYQNPPADEYENPITLRVVEKNFKLGKIEYPKGVELKMDGAEKPTKVYEGTVQIPFTLIATKPLAKGASTVGFKVDYQLCSMSSCWPPSSIVVKAPLKVVPAVKKAKA
ncbi:hypothetical protein EON82_12720 [bacterium]|nr:MAG: hypothetical protein EON82_12720 [bacterium]